MTFDRRGWIDSFAAELGVAPPTDQQVDALLGLAGVAARAAERTAAPISCWIAAIAGMSPDEALARARAIAERQTTDRPATDKRQTAEKDRPPTTP